MEWYYVADGERVGPVSEEKIEHLVAAGEVRPDTLIWCAGMENWQTYAEVTGEEPPGPAIEPQTELQPEAAGVGAGAPGGMAGPGQAYCAECGALFHQNQMIPAEGTWVCARCKPSFTEKMARRETAAGQVASAGYAGFWTRFVARFLDWLIVGFLTIALFIVLLMTVGVGHRFSPRDLDIDAELLTWLFAFAGNLLNAFVSMCYETYFIGRYAATPGKMALGLKVIRPDGSQITYLRALGRYFGTRLSHIILWIGFIIAAFDDEKRALHDYLCDTRVVYK